MDSSDDDDNDDLLFSPAVCSTGYDEDNEVVQAASILQQSCNDEGNGRRKRK